MFEKINVSIPENWLTGDKENYVVIKVPDYMYAPHFNQNDILIICKDMEKAQTNDIVLCNIDGRLELRRLCVHSEDCTALEGITNFIPPIIDRGYEKIGFLYILVRSYRAGGILL